MRTWFSKGHSEGKKVQAISRDLACQNSDSSSRVFLRGGLKYCSLDCNKKRISVETQKYETLNRAIFSRKESRESSTSFLHYESISYFKDTGWSCIILPMFNWYTHSFWLRNPSTLRMSGWPPLISDSSSCKNFSKSISDLAFSNWLPFGSVS